MLKPELIDALLSPAGFKECEKVVLPEVIHDIVYVSPLRRTIQTACEVLSRHPSHANKTIRLDPLIKEHMSYQNTYVSHKTHLLAWCKQLEEQYKLKIDVSAIAAIDHELWSWHSHPVKETKDKLLQLADGISLSPDECFDAALFAKVKSEAMMSLPGSNETYADMF